MNGRFALALTAAVFFAGFAIFFQPNDVSAGSPANGSSQLQIIGKRLIDTTSSQVTTTFSGTELHGYAGVEGGIGSGAGQFESKLSAPLLVVCDCAERRKMGISGSGCTVKPGTVKVKVELTSANTEVAQKLAQAGFKLESGQGTTEVTGTVLPLHLKELAAITEVKSVSLTK